ncbi:MAG: hypothetical protein AAFY08_03825 [Planctomycetota bacterium]
MDPISLVLASCLLIALVGLVAGLVGRRIGDTPYCGRCRFNLTGTLQNPVVGDETCPECGLGVAIPGRVRHGERRRRPGVIAIAAPMGLIVATGLWANRWRVTESWTFYAQMPNRVLLPMFLLDENASFEVVNRVGANAMSPAQVDWLMRGKLDAHGDPDADWDHLDSALVENAWRIGHLSEAEARRYLRQCAQLRLRVRPRVQVGREPTADVYLHVQRRERSDIEVVCVVESWWIDGEPALIVDHDRHTGRRRLALEHQGINEYYEYDSEADPVPLAQLAEGIGVRRLTVRGRWSVAGRAQQGRAKLVAVHDEPFELSADVEAVASTTGTYVHDAETLATFAEHAAAWVTAQRYSTHDGVLGTYPKLIVFLPPVDLPWHWVKYRAWLIADGRVVEADPIGVSSSRHGQIVECGLLMFDRLAGPSEGRPLGWAIPETATLVIRPDIDHQETRRGDVPVLLGEVVFKDLPLRREPVDLLLLPPYAAIGQQTPESMVEPKVQAITIEQAERTPRADG